MFSSCLVTYHKAEVGWISDFVPAASLFQYALVSLASVYEVWWKDVKRD